MTFFLNKNVKPEVQSPLTGGNPKFPLYVQVTYNRRNSQFRSYYTRTYSTIEEAYSTKENREHREDEKSLITNVVEYEIKHYGKDFQLKGLSDRYLDYSDSIYNPIDRYFREIIYNAVIKTDSEFIVILNPWDNELVSFSIYYKAATNLISDLHNKLPSDFTDEMKMGSEFLNWVEAQDILIRIVDWLNHSAIELFESHLRKMNFDDKRMRELIAFVNRILNITRRMIVY